MRVRKGIIVAVVISVFIIMGAWYLIRASLPDAVTHIVAFDDYFSEHARSAISQFINQKNVFALSAMLLCATLKQQFDQIAHITMARQSPTVIALNIESERPRALINDNWVVTQSGKVLARSGFAASTYQALPALTLSAGEVRIDAPLKNFIEQLQSAVAHQYDIVWADKTEVRFADKKLPNFFILTSSDQVVEAPLLHYCNRVKEMLKKKNVLGTKSKKRWIADVRFDHQIVVYSEGA